VTGLAAGWASGHPIFEAQENPGGICSSYYVRPGERERLSRRPADGETYRFEVGGGHWIFGGDPAVLRMIRRLTPMRSYSRHSGIYFPEEDLYVPYPIQDHLHALDQATAARALEEMMNPGEDASTMRSWLESNFGAALCEKFFFPFHAAYTAGLYEEIAPQDAYKSPVDRERVSSGALGPPPAAGYNTTFLYPENGLDELARGLAGRCEIHFGKRVEHIDARQRLVHFDDGSRLKYRNLLSTLPLNRTLELAGLGLPGRPPPYTSVVVLNLGARRGERLSDHQWLYVPRSRSGFHRVGVYSNVDRSFLPVSSRETNDRASLYVERACRSALSPEEVQAYVESSARELQDWGLVGEVEVADPTWIDVAYTWAWPGSTWRDSALARLEEHEIHQVGRYARWNFQGIADSIRDGLRAGAACEGSRAG